MIILISSLRTASKIRYEITRGNQGGAFAVKNETGAIYVAGPLDYETRKEVKFIAGLGVSVAFDFDFVWVQHKW